ncbi:unnamed protein product [Durusdinium trenchii]|uniref:Uncharacterized protein n=1 Tax=Durusdinium trenchii TaxID=1381693 RepID=A0ABP0NQX4_9DINO
MQMRAEPAMMGMPMRPQMHIEAELQNDAQKLAEKAKTAFEHQDTHELKEGATAKMASDQVEKSVPQAKGLLKAALQQQGGSDLAQKVFVTNIRDPWSRFWSQLRHEMAPCLSTVQALAVCVAGQHQRLGPWWSPTSHIDSVLGVSGFRISASPHIYSDNYYTRMLLNRTDLNGPPLTEHDYEVAKSILFQRMSAVIVVEDFARSALQLACTLGLNLEADIAPV